MKRLARGSRAVARKVEHQRRGGEDRQAACLLHAREDAQGVAVGHLRQGQVGEHEGNDGRRDCERNQRCHRLGGARPRLRAHAAGQHHGDGAHHHREGHRLLRLADELGRGVGGEPGLGGEQQQQRHGQDGGRDHAQCAALEAPAQVARDRVVAGLAQERREQHAHEDEAGRDAEAEAQGIVAHHEEGARESEKARAAKGADGEHEPVEDRRHAPAAGEIVLGLPGGGAQADGDVKRDGPREHDEPHGRVGDAQVLEHERHQHQRSQRGGENAEVGAEPRIDEPGARGRRHAVRCPSVSQMSSCAPCQWSMASWRLTNTATVTKAMIRSPWQARK